MKHIAIFISLIIIQSVTFATSDEVLSLLKRDLGKAIEVHGNNEIWYCPDNTCGLYKITTPHPDFSSFVYLHLFYESGYIYLRKPIGDIKAFCNIAVEEPHVRASVKHYCHGEAVTPECILQGMRERLGISVGFGRYDEGYFCYGFSEGENICKKL